jgi:hypothetical protein
MLFALEATGLCLLTTTFRQRLVETEAHLGRVFEDSPLCMLIIDGGPQILKANPAFRQLLRGELFTVMCPPSFMTMLQTVASPKPVPLSVTRFFLDLTFLLCAVLCLVRD